MPGPATRRRPRPRRAACESLEPRTHLSGDPHFDAVYAGTAYPPVPGALLNIYASHYVNDHYPSPVSPAADPNDTVRVFLSADKLVGNEDDILIWSTPYYTSNGSAVTIPTNVAPGTYNLIATCNDAYPYLGRTVTILKGTPGADLTIATGESAPFYYPYEDSFVAGEDHPISALFWNLGDTAVPSASAALYFSPTPALSSKAKLIDKASFSRINAKGLAETIFSTESTKTLSPGTYYPIIVIDPDHRVAETDETNNTVVAPPVSITGPSVDLAVTGVSVPPSFDPVRFTVDDGNSTIPYEEFGADVPVAVRVRSTGIPTTFHLFFTLSQDDTFGNADDMTVGSLTYLSADLPGVATYAGTVRFGILNYNYHARGPYRLFVRASPVEPDATPADNTFRGPMMTIGKPDLTASIAPSKGPRDVAAGTATHVSLVVKNAARSRVSRPYVVTYYLSTDADLSPDDVPFSKQTITASVPGGGSATIPLTYALPARTPAGTTYLIPAADLPPAARKAIHTPPDAPISAAARLVAATPIRVTAPHLTADLIAVRAHAVTVRLTNAGPATFAGAVTLRVLTDSDAPDTLLTARRVLNLKPGRHVDVALAVVRPAAAAGLRVAVS